MCGVCCDCKISGVGGAGRLVGVARIGLMSAD